MSKRTGSNGIFVFLNFSTLDFLIRKIKEFQNFDLLFQGLFIIVLEDLFEFSITPNENDNSDR